MLSQENITQLVSAFREGDANGFVQSLSQVIASQIAPLQAQVSALIVSSSIGNGVTGSVRSLDTDFIVHPTRDASVKYTIGLTAPTIILGGSLVAAQAELLIDGQVIQTVLYALSATLVLGVALTPFYYKILSATVPAGSVVNIRTTVQGAGATVSIASSQETLL